MIIDGKHVPNISCKRCRYRHPASLTCAEAAGIVQANRNEHAAVAAVLGEDLKGTDVLDARISLINRLAVVVRNAGFYVTRDQAWHIAQAVADDLREHGDV